MAPIIPPIPHRGRPLNPEPDRRPYLISHLDLDRCPHCGIAKPLLSSGPKITTDSKTDGRMRMWVMYWCSVCGGVVVAASTTDQGAVSEYYPQLPTLDTNIPEPARDFLRQAQESLSQPSGAVMLCASAVDAMLKEKGLTAGVLYDRINQAAKDNLITKDMAKWAHQVRLEANNPRHADQKKPLPTMEEAKRSVAFAMALAEFMFVLPAKVARGIEDTRITPGTA